MLLSKIRLLYFHMDLLFFGVFFVAFLFFIWAGRQFNNSTFLIVGGILSVLLAFFVFGSGLTYSVPVNQTMNYTDGYFKFLNGSATMDNCSNTTCFGVLDCSQFDNSIECSSCDQCSWNATGVICEDIAGGGSCNNSDTCLHCPGCDAYTGDCCASSYNLTAGGAVRTSVEYKDHALTETERIALALFFSLIGLYILIVELSGVIGSKGYNRQYGLDG